MRSILLVALLLDAFVTASFAQSFNVLVFTRTAGFRHESIPVGVAALRDLADSNCLAITATEDAAVFEPASLASFRVVVFLNTTGDILDPAQEAALEAHIRAGNGFVGVHSAADTEPGWPFYGQLVGARFANHPAPQTATINVEDAGHISTMELPNPWVRFDEWYNFQSNPRGGVRVLATLDESSYAGGTMGADHPIAWCHQNVGGRAWYTAGGHTSESYGEPAFRRHLLGGILWAAGREAFPACSADFNCDGSRDPDDLSDFITCFFLDVQTPQTCPASDFNGDGSRDPDDLSDFVTVFFSGC